MNSAAQPYGLGSYETVGGDAAAVSAAEEAIESPSDTTNPVAVASLAATEPRSLRSVGAEIWAGLGLASLLGLALGARDGGLAMAVSAVVVPAPFIAVAIVALPSLYLTLALAGVSMTPLALGKAFARAISVAGFVFAGLAPTALLFVVTSDERSTARTVAMLSLAIGGVLGLRAFLSTLRAQLNRLAASSQLLARAIAFVFALFCTVLVLRLWAAHLPLLLPQ